MNTRTISFAAALFTAAMAGPGKAIGSAGDASPKTRAAVRSPIEGGFPPLAGATGWLGSRPLAPAGLRGKVVLVEFWTFSCINWRRTAPYVRAWAAKYKDRGLVVIGVHSPEFGFERDVDSVRQAVWQIGIDHPIALDNDFAVWRAFGNQYWPALYFIDAQGRIRHHQFGEGDYERSERVIQELLAEAGEPAGHDLVSVAGRGAEAGPDWGDLKSDETYAGYAKAENFASPGGAAPGKSRTYAAPARLELNAWALAGQWTVGREAALLNRPRGSIFYRFHARDLHIVMGPAAGEPPIRFRVLLDGRAPGAAHGADIDAQGYGTATQRRLYQLIRQPKPIADRTFEIEFLAPGVSVYSFTFG